MSSRSSSANSVDESYGLDIGSGYEIIRFQVSTAVPTAPKFVDGVINLRGRITR